MRKLLQHLRFGVELIGVLCFLVMFGTFILQVFTRYVLNDPLGWTTEVSLIAFLWFAFWSGGLITRESDQVRFDLFYQHVSPKTRRVFAVITTALLAGLFLGGFPANIDYILFMAHDVTWVLEIRFDYVFAVFGIFLLALGVRGVWRLFRLLSSNWRDEI